MNDKCRNTFNKVKILIDKKKETLMNDIEPRVHDLSGAILLQYFENWINEIKFSNSKSNNTFEFLMREIKPLNSVDKFNEIKFCFNDIQIIKNYVVSSDKILIMLDGCASVYDHQTKSHTNIEAFNSITFKKNQIIDFESKCDVNYYIVVELNSPFL
jgi:hypothetical protein